jgi:hypothetical protein
MAVEERHALFEPARQNAWDPRHSWSRVVLSIATFGGTNILVIVAERLEWQRTLWFLQE